MPTLSRLRWQCRRGMLELDLALLSFLETHYSSLTTEQQQAFFDLLQEEDPVLEKWLLGQDLPQERRLIEIVQHIRCVAKLNNFR